MAGERFKRTLWLSADQLSTTSQIELAQSFNLRHSIPELIVNSSVRDCVLVVDGYEKLEVDARRRALELIRAVGGMGGIGWKLIIACQPQSWESVQDGLIEAGIAEFHKLDFEKPTTQEIYEVTPHLPEVRALLMRSHLRPILRNLVMLDWVLRADIAKRLSDPSRLWIGETELINWIWNRWMGDGAMRIARDSLLRNLGEREGEKLSGAVHVDTLEKDQLSLLGALAQEGLIRGNLPSVRFPHDLMGDWARFRVLTYAQGEAVQRIKAVAHIPRWVRAIRLYAQSLAECGDELGAWKAVTAQLGNDEVETRLVSDIFLDGLVFAANSDSLLQQVWPYLIADKGMILRRLLTRLQHAASVPDVRLRGLVDQKYADQSEAWFRIPLPLYWYPALRVFSRHSKDIAEHALLQAAEACALWLRTMPDGILGRHEAGLLALELAKETQGLIAEGMYFSGKDKIVYEALLSAGKEYPEEVAQIALELCARCEEPKHAIQRAIGAREHQVELLKIWGKNHPERESAERIIPPSMLSHATGQTVLPAPDGPLRRVSDGFRSAILETPSLNGLMVARPLAAKEILLAVSIEEPKSSDPYGERFSAMEGLGIANWRGGYPAFYWKGPFLKFLQVTPEQGLDAIIRIANFATGRWLENGTGTGSSEEERRKYGLEFHFDGKPAWWAGDGAVYGWHRYLPMGGNILACALMALEKWLYEELENDRSITQWVQQIYAHGESLSFAGVLISVGLKYPVLFTRELQPLLGNLHIYQCQLSLALSEQQEIWAIALTGQGDLAIKWAVEWNRTPHRRFVLQDIVPHMMLLDEGTRLYLSERVAEWAKGVDGNDQGSESLRFFLARFDLQNYTKTPQPDGRVLITMRWPEDLETIAREAQDRNELKLLSLSLASQSRMYLSEERVLTLEELPGFAAQVRRLANWQPSDTDRSQELYRINSLAGGLAVLVVQHRDWLSQDSELEKWCMDTLRGLRPVENSEYDSPVAVMYTSAESFLGEAGIALLRESHENWVSRMAFEGVTGFFYGSTFHTMLRAYLMRKEIGEKFGELTSVMVYWSALRRAANRKSGYQATPTLLAQYKQTLFRRYAAGEFKRTSVPLRRAEQLGRRLIDRESRRSMSTAERFMRAARRESRRDRGGDRGLIRELPDIDLEVLRKGYGFLWAMVRNVLPGEEEMLRRSVRELFELEMRTLPRPEPGEENQKIEGTPYEFDIWVMARTAEFLANANSVEVARSFYRPIIELGPAGQYWVEDFLQQWISVGLEMSPDHATFAEIWEDIVRYAMTLPEWQPGEAGYWSRAESLAVDLMGLHETAASVLGQAKYRDVVTAMAPVFDLWASKWLRHGSAAAWFASFLPTESGQVLLSLGIKQLAEALGSFEERDWDNHDLGPLFAGAPAACWIHLRNEVELQQDLRGAFLRILTELCALQIPEAMHLRHKVSEVLSTS